MVAAAGRGTSRDGNIGLEAQRNPVDRDFT
jgi:hypothetical protein